MGRRRPTRCSALLGPTLAGLALTAVPRAARRARRCSEPLAAEGEATDYSTAAYERQLQEKVSCVQDLLGARLGDVEMHVFRSERVHYLHRSGFAVWKYRASRKSASGSATVDGLPLPLHRALAHAMSRRDHISVRISGLLHCLRDAFATAEAQVHSLDSCDILSSLDGKALVALYYGRPLGDAWQDAFAQPLAKRGRCSVVGRGRGSAERRCLGPGRILQWFEVAGKRFPQLRREGVFCQSNLSTCSQMVAWAEEVTRPSPEAAPSRDLLELYCGNGNFTLPLAGNFRRVMATEVNKLALPLARRCAEIVGAVNITFMPLSAEETAAAVGRSPGQTLVRGAGIDPGSYDFSTIFLNPPRSGLDSHSRALAVQMDRVVYVSCSPVTLAADLEWFSEHPGQGRGLTVTSAALFDQFPYSKHAEVGLVLEQ